MLTYDPANAQHIGARREQQDSFAFSDPFDGVFVAHGGLLGMIADGMGGLEGGRQASGAAVAAFLAAYSRKTPAEQITAALQRSLSEANTAVKAVAQQLASEEGTGTTLVAGVIHNSSLYWISAGDSRMYVVRQGRLARVNADHTYVADLWPDVAAGRVDRQQAMTHPQAAHLTSYLGLAEVPAVDLSLRPFPLEPGDIFLACTDGVYRTLSEDEMAEAFRNAAPGPACETIKTATLAKNLPQQDNLTLIAIRLRDANASAQRPTATPALPAKRNRKTMIAVLGLEALLAVGLTAWHVAQRPATQLQHASSTQSPGTIQKAQDGKPPVTGQKTPSSGTATPVAPVVHGQGNPGMAQPLIPLGPSDGPHVGQTPDQSPAPAAPQPPAHGVQPSPSPSPSQQDTTPEGSSKDGPSPKPTPTETPSSGANDPQVNPKKAPTTTVHKPKGNKPVTPEPAAPAEGQGKEEML